MSQNSANEDAVRKFLDAPSDVPPFTQTDLDTYNAAKANRRGNPTERVRTIDIGSGEWIADADGCLFTHGEGASETEALRDLAERLWHYWKKDNKR